MGKLRLLEPRRDVDLADFVEQAQYFCYPTPDSEETRRQAVIDAEVDAIRREGDELSAARDFVGAIELYTQCIAKYQQFEGSVLRRGILLSTHVSRSEAYLWLHKYEKALEDAERALQFDSRHEMGLFCKGRALYHQGRYEEACTVFTVALHLNPADVAIRDALHIAKVGYIQARDGVYELGDFLMGGCRGPAPACSDYIGPVQIRYVDTGGRGLVTKEDVAAGQLLLVSNALSVACSPTEFWTEARVTKQNHDFLVEEMKELVVNSLRARIGLNLLSHDPNEVKSVPDMELFSIELEASRADDGEWEPHIDKEWLSGIVRTNAFDAQKCIDPVPFGDIETESNSGPGAGISSSGVWILPSFINHSCVSNCNMMFIGKAMFIRASRDVGAGEELTLSYCDPYEPEEYRQDSLKWWKFFCKCERCLLEQTLEKHEDATTPNTYSIEAFFSAFRNMWSDKPLVKLYAAHCKLVVNRQLNELTGIVDEVEKVIESTASKMGDRLQNWIRAPFLEAYTATILVHKDDLSKKVECLNRALDIMLSVAGGDVGAMQISSTLLRDSKLLYGEFSADYRSVENRVIDVCRATLGKHSREFFLALIAARFNSENQAFG